jgi:hypothetical protein
MDFPRAVIAVRKSGQFKVAFGEPHTLGAPPTCTALDPRQIELMLQLPHGFRHGRLADENRGSSARKAAVFRHSTEYSK